MADDRVLVTMGGSLVALNIDDGKELWTADVGHNSAAAPVLSDDTAYVTTWNGGANVDRGVAAIDLADGQERWRSIPDVDVSSAATLANDTLYVGGSINSRHVIALDAKDGTERWRFEAGQYAPSPAVSQEVVYVGGGSESVVYALDAADGEEHWRVDMDDRSGALQQSATRLCILERAEARCTRSMQPVVKRCGTSKSATTSAGRLQ